MLIEELTLVDAPMVSDEMAGFAAGLAIGVGMALAFGC
jgi:hypothetical protein